MSKSTQFSTDLLKLIFNGTPITGIADNAGTSPNAVLRVALHTADPGAGGNQSANEVSYTGYARVAVNRVASGWAVAKGVASVVSDIVFAQRTDAGATITATHASVGLSFSGAGEIFYSGALSLPIPIQQGTTPIIPAGSAITES